MSAKPGKSEMLSRWMHAAGVPFLLSRLPKKNALLVLNYHRIGDAAATPYDPQLYSATPADFEAQMEFVAQRLNPATLAGALSWIDAGGGEFRTLVTFDDGYLDNYEFARPVLRKLGIQGVFFIPTAFMGTRDVPWWDAIAYMVRNSRRQQFVLEYPKRVAVDIDAAGALAAAGVVQDAFKMPSMKDPERFLNDLEKACDCARPESSSERCFMEWDEVGRMARDGMALGGHTHTHRLLGTLSAEEQLEELAVSKKLLREKAGVDVDTIAYPVGLPTSFNQDTMAVAPKAGYRAGFSFYGGINRPGQIQRFDIQRVSVYGQSVERFRAQTAMAAVAGRYWP